MIKAIDELKKSHNRMTTVMNGLELSIDYLKRYIVFIRELIREKSDDCK